MKLWIVKRTKEYSYLSDNEATVVAISEDDAYRLLGSDWRGSNDLRPDNSTIEEVDLSVEGVLLKASSNG